MSLTDVRLITRINRKALAVGIAIALVGQLVSQALAIPAFLQPWLDILGSIFSAVCTVVGIFQSLKIQTIDLSKSFAVSATANINIAAGVSAGPPLRSD
jgi:hypothetical protein